MNLYSRIGTVVFILVEIVRGEKCHIGERQSPIDIVSKDARYQEFRPFSLTGHDSLSLLAGTLVAKNTGDTLKLLASANHTKALLSGGPLNVAYEFVEMHFHWGEVSEGNEGSEHSVDGQRYPLELHMVHRNIHDETVKEALEHENGLTVLGFKFALVKKRTQQYPNSGLDSLAKLAEKYLREPGSKVDAAKLRTDKDIAGDVNVVNFLPVLMDEYFHYHGSLTTGGCEESVNWMVFKNPLAVEEKHLRALQRLENTGGASITNNFRPTQPVNDRPIYYHGIDLIHSRTISRGSSEGLRSMKLPLHSDFLLTVPPCSTEAGPLPATMADSEEQRGSSQLWKSRTCRSSASWSLQFDMRHLLTTQLFIYACIFLL